MVGDAVIGFIIRRSLAAIPVLIVASMIVFMLLVVGGNPLEQLRQNPAFRPEDIARLTKEYGWDKPAPVQYMTWAKGAITGDFGKSITTQRPAVDMIGERLPLTLMLTGWSLMLSLIIAIPIGAYVAVKKYSRADYIATFVTFIMMATPSFFLALLFQLSALKMQDWNGGTLVFYTAGAPACAGTEGVFSAFLACLGTPVEVFRKMALPVIALSILQIAGWMRYQRSELLNVLNQDFMKSAVAKGLPGRRVFMWHAMRNALLPIITIVGLDVAMLFSGAVITERVFGLPGMGNLLLDSIYARDIVVVQAIVLIGAFLVLFFNTLVDILYGVFDPRVRVA
jgi:peptide/nickel transport system permease protein